MARQRASPAVTTEMLIEMQTATVAVLSAFALALVQAKAVKSADLSEILEAAAETAELTNLGPLGRVLIEAVIDSIEPDGTDETEKPN
jgi:hypothetical protein